MSSSEIKRKYF